MIARVSSYKDKVLKEIRCDYTGLVIDFDEGNKSYPSYNLR